MLSHSEERRTCSGDVLILGWELQGEARLRRPLLLLTGLLVAEGSSA